MKTRTSQNGVAGLMSRLVHNIKSAALALAALALAAPPALADLPAGYKQVEYIESSGTQRIKTGFTPACTDTIEMRIRVLKTGATQCLWCSRGNGTTTATFTGFLMNNNVFRFDRNGTTGTAKYSVTKDHDYKIVANGNSLTTTITDETAGSSGSGNTLASGSFTVGSPLGLLASHHSGVDKNLGNYATFRVYSFKVTGSDGTVKCELVPARRASDAVLGLYDVKRNQFLENAGTGVFTGAVETKVWSDGASGNFSAASSWQDGVVWPAGAHSAYFVNTQGDAANVTNDYTMSTSNKITDFIVQDGDFSITASKQIYYNSFHMINGTTDSTAASGTKASVVKRGDWTCIGYEFLLGWKSNVTVAFTNETGNISNIGSQRKASTYLPFQIAGWGSTSTTAPATPYSNIDAEFVVDGGSVSVTGCGNAGIACANNSNGRLLVNAGTMSVSTNCYVGWGTGSTGSIAVSGGTFSTRTLMLGCAPAAKASVAISGGAVSASDHVRLGYVADAVTTNYFEVAGGTFTQVASKNFYVGSSAGLPGTKSKLCVKGSGVMNLQNLLIVGYSAGGTVTVEDGGQIVMKAATGGVNMGYQSTHNGDDCRLNLFGGTLGTYRIYSNGGSAPSYVTFDGGTLKANAANAAFIADQSNIHVAVGAKGGTIDSAGFAITIPKAIGSGVSGETDGGLTFTGGGTITLSGANTYTGATVIDVDGGTALQMPAANNLAGNIVVTNATLAACPITVLTLTGEGADANDILSRCSLALDAPNTVELTADGASVKVIAKASAPATARMVYDEGTTSWIWEFRDMTDAVIPTVDENTLETDSITVRFGSTDELAAIAALDPAPTWVKDYQMTATFDLASASASTALPTGFTIEAGTVIDLKGCNWTLPDELKSATAAFTVTNSVDAAKSVLTVEVASGTFTETYLTLGGNLELNKTGAGTYAMTKDQPHTGGTVVTAGAMTSSANRTVAPAANSTGSLTIAGGTFTADADFVVSGGENSTGSLTVNSGTFTMTGSSRYLKLGNATGATGTVNLNGGEVVMNARGFTTGGGTGEVVFNGGTLTYAGINERALFQQNLSVKVGAGGGTIAFAAGKYPTNNLDMVSGVAAGETDGGMTFKGGGTFTALGQLAYNGGTTVEIGTTLVISDTSLGGGLVASLPATQPSAGTTNTLVTTTGEGVFTDSDLPDVSALPYYRAVLSEDAKSILIVRVAPLMTVTGFNLETGAITLGFEYIDAPLSLVVAWDTTDHGASLGSWPTGKSVILTNEVAVGTTTGTYTLPDDIFVVGMYYRLFLGDNATMPYDAEVAWIQPASSGAYMKTLYTPVKSSRAEFKFNMDNQTYSSGYKTIVGVSDGWPRGLRVSLNNDGWMQNVRVGTMRFAELGKAGFSKTADHVVKLNFGQTTTCFTIDDKNNNSIYHEFTDGSSTVTGNYNTYNNNNYAAPNNPLTIWANDGGGNPSMVKIYYLKWMNASGTVTRDYIPVVKDGEYCLYDKKTETLLHNAGAEGTSFTGGADTGNHPPVYFADGQMVVSDTQQYLGATVIDQENCSIAMDGATATINWALTQPGGTSAEIVAVFQTGSTTVTNVLATGVATASNGVATVENVYATGQITITLFARSGDNKSVNVSQTFSGTTVASVPTAPVLSVDETLHQIAATGMVSFGTGTTGAWLEYGATTSYGTRIDLALDGAGAWSTTIPYDDALWTAGKVYVRVKAVNEIAGIFGTSRQERTATANASFTAANRTVTQTAFDHATGSATFTFGGGAAAAQDLVVAWGDQDYGESLASWPRANRKVIGSVEADATTGTFTLPREACVSGNYYRFFLGVDAVAPYDEEVAWIQPDTTMPLGAYIQTSFRPSQKPQSETKLNLDNQSYGSTWATLYDAGTGWANGVWVYANQSGRIGARRAGQADFGPFSKTADLTVGLVPNGNYYAITVNGTTYTHNNFNQNVSMTPERDLSFWRFVNNDYGYSKYRLYWSKWWNASKNKLEAHFIPVKKDGAYGLCDIVSGKVSMNSGGIETAFRGGARTGYSPVTFATVQTAVSDLRIMGPLEIVERDWERPGEHVTLNWSAPMTNATLWAVYSKASLDNAPDESVALSDWDARVQLPIDNPAVLAADVTGGTFELVNPIPNGYRTMRFVIATSGSTESNLVPLLFSEPYKTLRAGTAIFFR